MSAQRLGRSASKRLAFSIKPQLLGRLADASIQGFKAQAFSPGQPVQLPRELVTSAPAVAKWFKGGDGTTDVKLNVEYLKKYGALIVPLELTYHEAGVQKFQRVERPLSDFLSFLEVKQEEFKSKSEVNGGDALQIYLAQCSISSLPSELVKDLPTPVVVSQAGRGDVYDSSIWIGLSPTYTPLHKDPNPNLFMQLAGQKIVRMFEPEIGAEIFAEAQRLIDRQGSASFRGEEMMQGEEKQLLEEIVWPNAANYDENSLLQPKVTVLEAVLEPGDAIFIPKGWWHSIRGIGTGVVGSVNWWFR